MHSRIGTELHKAGNTVASAIGFLLFAAAASAAYILLLVFLRRMTSWAGFDYALALLHIFILYAAHIGFNRLLYAATAAVVASADAMAILHWDSTPAQSLFTLAFLTVAILVAAEFVFQRKRAAQTIEAQNLLLEEAVEEARLAGQAKDRFLSNVSH